LNIIKFKRSLLSKRDNLLRGYPSRKESSGNSKLRGNQAHYELGIAICQGSQTQIDWRATFQRKKAPRAAVYKGKSIHGLQTTRKALKIS
jgi:hypothetical protein